MVQTRQKQNKPAARGLSERNKWTLLISASVILVLVGGWWAYFEFTTVPPPPIEAASDPEAIVAFLGNARGFTRMAIDDREQYLIKAYQHHWEGEARQRFIQSLNRMSTAEKQVLLHGLFQITHKHVMHHARAYNSLPVSQRGPYLDKAVGEIEALRSQLGGGSPDTSMGEPLRADLPTSSDAWMKILITHTGGQERAEAKPFVDAMADRYKAMQNPRGGVGG